MSTPSPRESADAYGPWHPGVESPIPEELRPLATVFRPENVLTPMAAARELRDLTGLDLADLVAFRPERLALHEVLIRVTANISVPVGERIGDLGINFRRITRTILASQIEARMQAVAAAYATVKLAAAKIARAEVDRAFDAHDPHAIVAEWEKRVAGSGDAVQREAHRALARVISAVRVRHGRLWGLRDVIAALACDLACNAAGSEAIGALIEPWVLEAARREGYRVLPPQERPVVMNTKGPSASGKSSLRPLQRRLAAEIGVQWEDFSLVSPDIWRKQLLEYESLGPAFRYAGPFTGEELRIVDLKLDKYMAAKAERGAMSHLLIDRFRFDSFAPQSDEAGSNLLTRFGHTIYLFFMITPPGMLVERAWTRGLEFGRYKAVEDTLAHGVEAYAGMPELFFTWVRRTDKRVHFEFLDNSVALGERPRTIAFGWNDIIYILDREGLLDVERFRHVNIKARSPAELWADPAALAPGRNDAFLKRCIAGFREVVFVGEGSRPIPAGERAHTLGQWSDRPA
ncbi:MAG TPA: hypothetical protein VFP44_02900 [Usitatibacter sp.]|nr:hypothetical protein [Usitatibacter sp.]